MKLFSCTACGGAHYADDWRGRKICPERIEAMALEPEPERSRVEAAARAICEASMHEHLCGSGVESHDENGLCISSCVSCRNAARNVLSALQKLEEST